MIICDFCLHHSQQGACRIGLNIRKTMNCHESADLCKDKRPDDYVFVSPKDSDECQRPTRWYRGANLEGSRATLDARLAEAGCDAFTIAQLLGHSDVRLTMRYMRAVETSKRVAVEAVRLNSGRVGEVLVSWPKQPPVRAVVSNWK